MGSLNFAMPFDDLWNWTRTFYLAVKSNSSYREADDHGPCGRSIRHQGGLKRTTRRYQGPAARVGGRTQFVLRVLV